MILAPTCSPDSNPPKKSCSTPGVDPTPRRFSVQVVFFAKMSAFVVVAGAVAAFVFGHYHHRTSPPPAFRQAVYVWQEAWTPPVAAAVSRSASAFEDWMVYAAQLTRKGENLETGEKAIQWSTLAERGLRPVLVIRVEDAVKLGLKGFEPEAVATRLASLMQKLSAEAERAGVATSGFQLDYDAPTSRLREYARLLSALRLALPGVPLSITVLPDWLNSSQLPNLLTGLDFYVLQVHSLSTPNSIADPYVLCDVRRLQSWLKAAARVKVPYFVALPTYGYRFVFDAQGAYAGFGAEGRDLHPPKDFQIRDIISDPVAMAGVVRDLRSDRPESCLGIVWFRLPVETDRLNWAWPEMQAVMAGREPRTQFSLEIRTQSPGLAEAWIVNTGEVNLSGEVRVKLEIPKDAVVAYDVLSGFHPEGSREILRGPGPRLEEPILAAWFRLSEGSTSGSIRPGPVEIVP